MIAPDDTRITCETCRALHATGDCLQAARGRVVGATKRYTPVRDLPRRCEGYAPLASDPDQRPGSVRYRHILDLERERRAAE